MSDSWCTPVRSKSGKIVSGGAARNVRIAASGGMDDIIKTVVEKAVSDALELANAATRRTHLRLVR